MQRAPAAEGSRPRSGRVGLACPRFTAFDPMLGDERVARLRERHALLAAALEADLGSEIVDAGGLETAEDVAAARRLLDAANVDVLVVAPAMAAPPDLGLALVEGLRPPVVIWNAIGIDRLDDAADQAVGVEHTTTVGCQFLVGAMARMGLAPAAVVTTAAHDPASRSRLRRSVRAAGAAGAVRGDALVRIGAPPPGYLNVAVDDADLAALGLRVVDVDGGELETMVGSATAADVAQTREQLEALGVRPPAGGPTDRSLRLARALGLALDLHGAAGGVLTCMGPQILGRQGIGVTACLGVALQTALGRPLACMGDLPAAVAMLLAERLAGAALYAEWYASESASDTGLVLGAGEADPRWAADPGAITVRPATHAPGLVDRGWALGFEPRSGPATVLALGAAQDGWRLAWGTGTVSAGPPGLRGPAARLTLDGTDTLAAATRLIESGVTHHVVLAPGRLDVELPVVAACLRARTTQLSA